MTTKYDFRTMGTNHLINIFFSKDQYYSVQTTEGEQISALIAGYIDIILKRRQRKERFGEDGNEEEYLEESFIHPGRAIEIHGLPQTLKKAKPDSLAKPGLLRNSGGKIFIILLEVKVQLNKCMSP